jgi:hypothetical protein
MIHNQSCVNGILAAVLSASVIPLHGALAREKSARLQKATAKHRPASPPERDAVNPASARVEAPAVGPSAAQ